MTSRREFLQIGIAASALPLATQAARAAGLPPLAADEQAHAVRLYKVVYDTRIPASVAFARRAEASGVATYPIEGDMTRFWYEDLYHRWRSGPAAIAGLTAHGALFCLERLAWDQGLRVVFRGEHTPGDGGIIRHALSGPVSILRDAEHAATRTAWSEGLAEIALRVPSGRTEMGSGRAATQARIAMPEQTDALYTWVIAPARA